MGRPRVRPLVTVQCGHCGATLTRTKCIERPNQKYYCNYTCRNLGYRGHEPARKWHTKALLTEFRRVTELLGHIPLFAEFKEHSLIYPSIYQKRFGTWDSIIKLAFPEYDCDNPKTPWTIDDLTPEDGGWLAGMCAGESCFRIQKNRNTRYSPVWHINLRADDASVIAEIKRLWRLDHHITVWDRSSDRKKGEKAGDAVCLTIRDIPTILSRVIPTFERYKMRAKKQADFELFKRAVELIHKRRQAGRRYGTLTDEERNELDQLYVALMEVKKYKVTLDEIMERFTAVRVGNH